MRDLVLTLGVLGSLCVVSAVAAAELAVGPGKPYATPEEALKAAGDGDVILVHPREGNKPYEQVGLWLKKRVTLRAASQPEGVRGQRVRLSGEGRDYVNPRALVQFDPGSDGSVLEGFEIFETKDKAGVGAGIRINQANNITVRNCDIHDCGNGIFSNGRGRDDTAANQLIENCAIHHNGVEYGPGTHNLYVAGASVTMRGCEVHAARTGHNFKSRAHRTLVEYCYIHDSINRELDLVDGKGDTDIPDSDVVVVGCLIVKDPNCKENPHTIHFGQDGNVGRVGTLHLINNTIVSPFKDPVLEMSSPQAKAHLVNNIFWNGGTKLDKQGFIFTRKDAKLENVTGERNWFSVTWSAGLAGSGLDPKANLIAPPGTNPPFVDAAKNDFRLDRPDKTITDAGLPWKEILVPPFARPAKGAPFAVRFEVRPLSLAGPHGGPGPVEGPLEIRPRVDDGTPDLGAYELDSSGKATHDR